MTCSTELRYGTEINIRQGESVFEQGANSPDLYLILEGELEVSDTDATGNRHAVARIEARQFTGELDLLTGRPSLVSCTALINSRLLRVESHALHRLLTSERQLAETVLFAWIQRRANLIGRGTGGVILLSKSQTADILTLQQFLSRNALPHQVLYFDRDEQANVLANYLSLSAGPFLL